MPRTSRPIAFAALAFVTAIVAASCAGSSGGSDGSASTTEAPTTTTAPVTSAPTGKKATSAPVPSAGCGAATAVPATKEKQYLDDSDRWFLITTPSDYEAETPLPLVVDYHGLSEGADVHALMSKLPEYGQEHGFIVISPEGQGTPVRWQVEPDTAANADLQYTEALLDQLEATQCVDTSRIYATGLSNGAFMSSVVACTMADRFVAVAPVAGLIRPESCDPSRPVPVQAFHGTADPILLFNGGVGDRLNEVLGKGGDVAENTSTVPEPDLNGPGYPAAAQEWATGNGCTGDPSDEDLTTSVLERTWSCPDDAPVEFLIIDGGGHSWPGSEFSQKVEKMVGPTDTSIDADELMWAFFQRFSMPTT